MVAPLGPGAVTIASSGLSTRLDRQELLLGQPDDRVDVVAGLDDGADAADLVDPDGDRSLSDGDLDVDDRAGQSAVQGRGRDLRTGRDRLACDLSDDLRRVGEGAGADRGRAGADRRHLLGLDACRQRDVRGGDDDRAIDGARVASLLLLALRTSRRIAHEGDDRQEDPDE